MFCQYCGAQLEDAARFCAGCGRPLVVAQVAIARPTPAQSLGTHLRVMGALWAAYAALRIVGAVGVLTFRHYVVPLFLEFFPHDTGAFRFPMVHFLSGIYVASALFSAATAVIAAWAAWALLQRERSGRTIALVAAFVSLISVPLGTAIGVYTLVILLPQSAKQAYDGLATSA
jgi:hypothetical protein